MDSSKRGSLCDTGGQGAAGGTSSLSGPGTAGGIDRAGGLRDASGTGCTDGAGSLSRPGKSTSLERLGGLDRFKLAAAYLVAAIHTSPLASFSESADFLLTRIIARIAVPFFLMVTGYFLLPRYFDGESRDYRPLREYLKKTAILYAVAAAIYLPVNLYAGQLQDKGLTDILRMILFDGTFYHLWYLPASILGICLIAAMSRVLSFRGTAGISLILYVIGLFGDSYYGVISGCEPIRAIYETIFCVSSYTRNGIFYVPVFLVMGAGLQRAGQKHSESGPAAEVSSGKRGPSVAGFFVSLGLMIAEGIILNHFSLPRHDSMYLFLLPCMMFLFRLLLSVEAPPAEALRDISTWIYILHPLVIILVRGVSGAAGLQHIFVENSLIHYFTICLLSTIFADILRRLLAEIRRKLPRGERAWTELDMENLRKNVTALKSRLPAGCELMPAVKANAYGHGAAMISKELERQGIRAFCVATAAEGIELWKNGIKGDILVLGYTPPDQFPLLRKYDLIQTVVDLSYGKLLDSYGHKLRVHVKIDTGMHRLGQSHEDIEEICQIFRLKNLRIEGTFTHLCCSDSMEQRDEEYTLAQCESFRRVIEDIKERGFSCGKVHVLASYGILHYPQYAGDFARPGIALYGALSSREDLERSPVKLYPVLSLRARVALIRELRAGESAGYGLQYTAEHDCRIAVLSIGYADGIPRALSCGRGKVLINGKEAPIAGRICMDQMLADVTEIADVKSGDVATLIGKDGDQEITVYDMAEACGTITNEIMSRLGQRLERIAADRLI